MSTNISGLYSLLWHVIRNFSHIRYISAEDADCRPVFFPLSAAALLDGDDTPTWYPDLRRNVTFVEIRGDSRGGSGGGSGRGNVMPGGLPSPETSRLATVHYVRLEAMRLLGRRSSELMAAGKAASATILMEIKDTSRQDAPEQVKVAKNQEEP